MVKRGLTFFLNGSGESLFFTLRRRPRSVFSAALSMSRSAFARSAITRDARDCSPDALSAPSSSLLTPAAAFISRPSVFSSPLTLAITSASGLSGSGLRGLMSSGFSLITSSCGLPLATTPAACSDWLLHCEPGLPAFAHAAAVRSVRPSAWRQYLVTHPVLSHRLP